MEKKNMFLESAQELKKIRVLTLCAMLCALSLVLKMVSTINIGPYLRIGFSGLPGMFADMAFGPVTGSILAAVQDIVNYMIRPDGPFFFGFTFNAMLGAFIYGVCWYKKKMTFGRVLLAKGIVNLVVNVFFNTLWLSMLYGQGFMALLPARAIKNLVSWPVESLIFFLLVQAVERSGIMSMLLRSRLASE